MVVQIIAAAARAGIKQAAKKGASNAAKKAAKKSVNSSDVYNARKRYVRAAKKAYKESQELTGVARDIKRELAEEYTKRAMRSYEKETNINRVSKDLRELNSRLGLNRDSVGGQRFNADLFESQSKKLVKINNQDQRRDNEARTLMSGTIGKGIYGGLSNVWKNADDINGAIIEHVGARDLMGVIEKIAEKVDLFELSKLSDQEKYDLLKQEIEKYFG